MTGRALPLRLVRFLPFLVLAAAIVAVYAPVLGHPLRLWDHHALLLLAKGEQFQDGLLHRLAHYRLGPADGLLYFKVLAMPTVYAVARAAGDARLPYYAFHWACHLAACLALYRLVRAAGGARALALGIALLFAVFSAHSETLALPFYSYMLLATALAGTGLRILPGRPVRGTALLVLAALFYDAFLLPALGAPLLAWRRGMRRRCAALLCGSALCFAGVAASLGPGATGAWASLSNTLALLPGSLDALLHAQQGLLADLQLFLPCNLPGTFSPGNSVYWDPGSMQRLWMLSSIALVHLLAGAWLWPSRPAWGAALALLGALLDPWTVVPAGLLLLAAKRGNREGLGVAARLLLLGLLCGFQIALARRNGYNVFAPRHHYLSAFFLLGALGAALAGAWRAGGVPRLAAAGALVFCILLNSAATQRAIREIPAANAAVFDFDRLLGTLPPASLFVPRSQSTIRGRDWTGHPMQDFAFDVLHRSRAPLTRHSGGAPLLLDGSGHPGPNPAYGKRSGDDFLLRFTLSRLPPPGRLEVFGSAPGESRLLFQDGKAVLEAPEGRWEFPLDLRPLPVECSLERSGDALRWTAGGERLECRLPEGRRTPWTSDNLGLLGRDFESLTASFSLYDGYLRIGPPVESPPSPGG